MQILKCPCCGKVPKIAYVCGEYFVMGDDALCPGCGSFSEMHSNEDYEIVAWNRWVLNERK